MRFKLAVCICLSLFSLSPADNISGKLEALCSSLVDSLPASVKSARVAVIPFEDKTGNDSYGLSTSEYLVVLLKKRNIFSLVDRTEFKKVVEEINLSRSDYAEETNAIEVGKVLAADYILTGSVFKSFGNYSIVAKLIKTETTEIVSSATVNVIPSKLDSFTKDLLSEKNRVVSSFFRSALFPGWGQIYSDQNTRGIISMISALGMLGVDIGFIISAYNAHIKRDNHYDFQFSQEYVELLKATNGEYAKKWEAEYEDYKKDYSDNYRLAVIFGAVAGGVWALNLVDAAIAGSQAKKKFQLYFSSDFINSSQIKMVYSF